MARNRYWEFSFLALRDGEKCNSCGKSGSELVIDHIDGNRQNEAPINKQLLCRSCNGKKHLTSVLPVSVKENEKIEREGEVERESPELKVAREKQPDYVTWLFENVDREGGLTFWAAIYEGSDRNDISPVTARRYLYKKLATTLRLGAGARGHRRILWRDGVRGNTFVLMKDGKQVEESQA